MSNFYGNNIDEIPEDCLLQATPFVKDTRYNFDGELKPDYFFKHLYKECIKSTEKDREEAKRIDNENDLFNKKIDDALGCLNNRFSRIDAIHIAGYGGCGKTTFLRHRLWELKRSHLDYVFIDFEGTKVVEQALLESIQDSLRENFREKASYLHKISMGKIFSFSSFENIEELFNKVAKKLWLLRNNHIDPFNYNFIRDIKNIKGISADGETYAYLLLVINFFLLVWRGIEIDDNISLVLVYDNVDSIEDDKQESILLSSMVEFINDCNYFINANVTSSIEYNGVLVGDAIKRIKFLFLLTTRVVTGRRYAVVAPDLERVPGWYSLSMPEHYYDHFAIINKRVDYYIEHEPNSEQKEIIQALIKIRDLSDALYRTNSFKRIFNGNVRYCFMTLLALNNNYADTGLVDRCIELKTQSPGIRGAHAGASGIALSLLLDYFKKEGVYEDKLHLSACKRDYKVSFSRLVLTFIREKGNRCSLVDLYECLIPYFNEEKFSRDIFALSESKRDVWRRLITFGNVFPKNDRELDAQLKDLQNGKRDRESFSELYLCLSGMAYLDFVIPHFEYMLSRHNNALGTMRNFNYWPLFAENSLNVINEKANDTEEKYLFERKIKWVYRDVSDCCDNSVYFAQKVCEENDYTRSSYLEDSKLNYTSFGDNGETSMPQSYESRLIFGHVSYIERFRQYIMYQLKEKAKLKSGDDLADFNRERRDVNRRLVVIIKKYLELYSNDAKCFKTPRQSVAHGKLMEFIDKIERTDYKDFDTIIELT